MSGSMTNTQLQNTDHNTFVKTTNSMQFTKYESRVEFDQNQFIE